MNRPHLPVSRFFLRSAEGYQRTPLFNLDSDVADGVAKMRLYDPVDSWGEPYGVSAKDMAAALDALPDEVTDIHLHINSPGGEVFEAVAMMNLLRQHAAKVTSVVDGIAASAASVIAASSDVLVMAKNSELMIHDAFGLCVGPAEDMHKMADVLDHLSDNIASVYADKAGGTTADWRSQMLNETWYSAQEAVDSGLADQVETATEEQPKDRFDLSLFQHAGRSKAPAPVKAQAPVPDPVSEPAPMAARQARRHQMNARKVRARS